MLNFEKYWPKIETFRNRYKSEGEHYPIQEAFKRVSGEHNEGIMPGTIGRALEWLFSEYEPPLLENGDGLKPGDWIMVRDVDSQSFVRRQFLYFFDGKFVCSAPNHAPLEGFAEPWVQARLPEEGE